MDAGGLVKSRGGAGDGVKTRAGRLRTHGEVVMARARGTRVPHREQSSARAESARDRAEAERHGAPRLDVRMCPREVEVEPANGADDLHADLQERESQAPDLRARQRRPRGAALEALEQHVGGGTQQHAELIGPEARATRASEREVVVEFLEAISVQCRGRRRHSRMLWIG